MPQPTPAPQPINPGQIIEPGGSPRWVTQVGPFELQLDIIPAGQTSAGHDVGIASFVVMEQTQPFLDYCSAQLAQAIAARLGGQPVLLLTAETKGAHLAPWVWKNLFERCGHQLEPRIITLRKGQKKIYMQRPARSGKREIAIPSVSYPSITSARPQTMRLAPKDLELLLDRLAQGVTPVFVDDFIGRGGTVVGLQQLFDQLHLAAPRQIVAIGTDGDLYRETFATAQIEVELLPSPFLLKLPTFLRSGADAPWQIAPQ